MGLLTFSSTESASSSDASFWGDSAPSSSQLSSLQREISPREISRGKINFVTIKISQGQCYFADGEFDGEVFKKGATVIVEPQGEWALHSTIAKGHPAIVCTFFNKRTQMMEQRYIKVFFKDGLYRCGPRFPKKIKLIDLSGE